MKKSLFITIAFLLLASMTFAQSGKLNRANRHFEKGNYEKAIVLYDKILKKNIIDDATINLTWSYIKIENFAEAEYWISQTLLIKTAPSEYWLYYAVSLFCNDKFELGVSVLDKYKTINPNDERIIYLEEIVKNYNYALTDLPIIDCSKIMIDLE